MKVFLKPGDDMSRAMFRVADALWEVMPKGWEVVQDVASADLVVVHVCGVAEIEWALSLGKPYAVIQYCLKTAGGTPEQWRRFWDGALCVWSYYDLESFFEGAEGD
jgi:hypothetical protein